MNKMHILSGVACVSVFLATGAFAEILGVQPGTSDNPKDNVPKEIQRATPGGGTLYSKAKWDEFKGDLKQEWDKFTDDDLLNIRGD